MNGGKIQAHIDAAQGDAVPEGAPLGGTKAEATQRLQIGLFGLGSMVLLIGLATIIGNQANLTQEGSVPEAAPTTEPVEAPQQSDPLADAGIVPDIPAEPVSDATQGPTDGLSEDQSVEDVESGEDGSLPSDATLEE
ncbi:MAG: hypothetical protein ABJ205_04030 [Erythrobacter sp.]|uniref:hypothetical protein n=1 Tax=Erythrobacter sp. TaxID=1042 RepID=UPI003267BAF9